MAYIAGLDIGSALSKAVIMRNGTLISSSIRPTEGNFVRAAEHVLADALQKAQLAQTDIERIGACGLGVAFIAHPFTKITEISCQSRGTHSVLPTVRTLIEIGNQSSRVIKVTPKGKVADCLVSDKCAAGSGRILQIIARVLGVSIEDLGPLSAKSTHPAKFTTGCAVFLETEAISRVAEGTAKEDIIAGLHRTLAAKIAAMAHRMGVEEDCAMTGGGAVDSGLVKIMEAEIGKKILAPQEPFITAAIGAALIVAEK
ncbi:MAG: 2-hydroxyglutaryl-CoA dehydratase [Desulfobacterales bacterium]|nr:MAG: 2-hydroxyglutaryl-CoA dehydratase [Desulfobacterales bacterium]